MSVDRHLPAQLRVHQSVFDELLDRAERALSSERHESAAALLTMAADVAARNHAGRYTDDRMERLLRDVSGAVRTLVPAPVEGTDGRGDDIVPSSAGAVDDIAAVVNAEVVHVLSDTPSRAVEESIAKWMNHGEWNSAAVSTADPHASILDRAATLRAQVAAAEVVVVHTDPDDIVPILAFTHVDRAPVVWVNHHETSFWPGVSVADLVVSHQATGSALAVDRRCVPVGRTMMLPPFAAEAGVWERVLRVVDERVREMSPVLAPPRLLPRPFDGQDLERVRLLRSVDRADGLLGAYRRHGEFLDPDDRPELTVVVLAQDADRTIECLHRVLDTWHASGSIQLLVVDHEGSRDIGDMIEDLTGTIRGVRSSTPGELVSAVSEGLRWAWGPYVAILSDDASPMVGWWEAAIADLEFERSRPMVPLVSADNQNPDGLMMRTAPLESPIEQAFGLLSEGTAGDVHRWLSPRQRRLSPVSSPIDPAPGDH